MTGRVVPVLVLLSARLGLAASPGESAHDVVNVGADSANTPLVSAWKSLFADGCRTTDVAKLVRNPVTARVVRNVPFALRARTFADPDLAAFFRKDGSWYRPRTEDVRLSAKEAECTATLRKLEDGLRARANISAQLEGLILRDHDHIVGDLSHNAQKHICGWWDGKAKMTERNQGAALVLQWRIEWEEDAGGNVLNSESECDLVCDSNGCRLEESG